MRPIGKIVRTIDETLVSQRRREALIQGANSMMLITTQWSVPDSNNRIKELPITSLVESTTAMIATMLRIEVLVIAGGVLVGGPNGTRERNGEATVGLLVVAPRRLRLTICCPRASLL